MAGLIAFVHVFDDDGDWHVFGPGDVVPAWAAKKITNPDAWDGGRADDTDGEDGEAVVPPPMTGPGSGKDAWSRYAAARGVTVPDGARRDEIVQALRDAGAPVEQDEE